MPRSSPPASTAPAPRAGLCRFRTARALPRAHAVRGAGRIREQIGEEGRARASWRATLHGFGLEDLVGHGYLILPVLLRVIQRRVSARNEIRGSGPLARVDGHPDA